VPQVKDWRETVLRGGSCIHPKDKAVLKNGQIMKPKQKIGNLVLNERHPMGSIEALPVGPKDIQWYEPPCRISQHDAVVA